MGHTWSLFSVRMQSKRQCGPRLVGEAQTLQDTRSCVVPRPSDESNDAESLHRTSRRFFYVYVDNLGVRGTSRVNVDEDLMMAVQTLKRSGCT